MKKLLPFFALLFLYWHSSQAQIARLIKIYESENAFGSCINRDNNGFIYTSGRIGNNSIAGPGDTIHFAGIYLTKMNAAGNEIWRSNSINGSTITPRSVLFDNSENIYVIGNFYDTLISGTQIFTTSNIFNRKFFIAKFNSNGNLLWIKAGTSEETFIFSATVFNNQLWLAGGFSGIFNYNGATMSSAGSTDMCILKMDTAGNLISSNRFGGSGEDLIQTIKTDVGGNIYACGRYAGNFNFGTTGLISHGDNDGFIVKLDASLNVLWLHTAGTGYFDEMRCLAVDSSNAVYVGGVCGTNLVFDPLVATLANYTSRSGFIAKYNSAGTYLNSSIVINYGNVIDIELVNNKPVLCGKSEYSSLCPHDQSITLTAKDGYFMSFDQNLNTIMIGSFTDVNGFPQKTDRCFSILPYDNQNFLISGYSGADVKMPDSVYHHSSFYSTTVSGGFAFLQKINIPHLTLTPADSVIVPALYSTAYPLNLLVDFNGQYFAGQTPSIVKLGYPKTGTSNYSLAGTGNYNSGNVIFSNSLTNPSGGSGNYYFNLNFSDKNLMIRSENDLEVCASFSSAISGPSAICSGDTITLSGSAAYTNYSWIPSSLIIVNNGNSISTSPIISTTYNYVAHNNTQCVVGVKTVAVNNQSLAHLSFTNTTSANCSPIQFSYAAVNCVSVSGGTFVYFYKNGLLTSSSSLASGTFNATTIGSYFCKAVSGCGWEIYSDTITITSIIPPITSSGTLVTSGNYLCNGSSILLTLTNHPANVYFEWYHNGFVMPNANSDTLTIFETGNYYVKVYNSCNSSIVSNYVYINQSGVLNLTISTSSIIQGCYGNSVYFSSTYNNYGPGAITLQWYKDGFPISGASSNSYSTATSGSYMLRINHSCGYSYSNTIQVHLNNPVVAAISNIGSSVLCNGQSTTLTASPGIDYVYQWRLNTIDISGATNQNYIATAAGLYNCFISNFCNANLSNSVVISSAPTLPDSIFSNDSLNICPGQSITFYAAFVSGINYQWFKDSNPISGATLNTHVSSVSGVYSCRFTNSCGIVFSNNMTLSTFSLSNVIYAPGGTNLCPGDSIYLYASNNNQLYYQWLLNGIAIAGATNAFYYATNTGSYSCRFTSAGCGIFYSGTINITQFQFSSLVINSSQGNVLCGSATVILTAPSGLGFSFQWMLNGMALSGATNSYFPVQQPGIYSCAIFSSCLNDTTSLFTVSQGPPPPVVSILFSANDTICAGDSSLLISSASNAYTYQWRFNGLEIAGATNSFYYAHVQGQYQCSVTNFCDDSISNSLQLVIIPFPSSNVYNSGDTILCDGQTELLSVQNNIAFSYQWFKNGIQISGATNYQLTVSQPGNYYCALNSPCGVNFSTQVNIVVSPPLPSPTVSVLGNLLFCNNLSSAYQWYLNGTPISGAINQSYQATQFGYYSVEVFNNQGCSAFANPVYFNAQNFIPVSMFSYSANSICQNQCITFYDNSTNQPIYWAWSFQGGNPAFSNIENPTVCYNQPGNYNVQLITGNSYGYDTLLINQIIVVNGLPTAAITQQHDTLSTSSGMAQYQWSLNGNAIAGATNYFYIAQSTGNYTVFCQNTNGCSQTSNNTYSYIAKPLAFFTQSSNEICQTECISFSDSSTNQPNAWQWFFPGSTIGTSVLQNPVACYNQPGIYDVILISTNTTGSDTFLFANSITVNAFPNSPIITPNGNILTSSNAFSYQWLLNGVEIPGAIFQQIIIVSPGSYSVLVSDSNGCSSSSLPFNYVGINEMNSSAFQISISPNPTEEKFSIQFNDFSATENLILILTNVLGEQIQTKQLQVANGNSQEIIDCGNFASGCYLVSITGNKINYTQKLVIAH